MTSENLRIRLDSSAVAGADAEGSTTAGVAIAEEVDWDRGRGFDGLVVMIAGVARLAVPSTAASASASVSDACLGLPRRSSSPSALRTGLAKGLDTAERSPSVTVSALVGLVSESLYPPKPCASACSDGPLRVGVSCTC